MDNLTLPSVCGHKGDILVQYSARKSDKLPHTICKSCYDKDIYYCQIVEGVDIILEGGNFVIISL